VNEPEVIVHRLGRGILPELGPEPSSHLGAVCELRVLSAGCCERIIGWVLLQEALDPGAVVRGVDVRQISSKREVEAISRSAPVFGVAGKDRNLVFAAPWRRVSMYLAGMA
jgi:hypothetical protein